MGTFYRRCTSSALLWIKTLHAMGSATWSMVVPQVSHRLGTELGFILINDDCWGTRKSICDGDALPGAGHRAPPQTSCWRVIGGPAPTPRFFYRAPDGASFTRLPRARVSAGMLSPCAASGAPRADPTLGAAHDLRAVQIIERCRACCSSPMIG